MQSYKAPLNDMKFILEDFLSSGASVFLFKKNELEIEDFNFILEEASKFCEEILLPLNQSGDKEGCAFDNGIVTTPKGFKDAYKQFVESGWQSAALDKKYGGQGLPYIFNVFFDEMITSSNMGFGNYPGLTGNAFEAIKKSASEELKELYLPRMATGEWTGTMNLTEPQCGTDLGLSKAMATPQKDGFYKLTGTKIFITGGEQDLSENIIHLVLARTPGAPKGIKGISLFLVPKVIPNKDGSLGERNSLSCGSIEDKMGIKSSSTCVMNYNEAKSWLVGDLHKGMKAMFIMMNGARLMVGVQGLGMSEVSYQSALYYAHERLQGRSLSGSKNPELAADPIIVHSDVRKNLLKMKALNEGIRGLISFTALQLDVAKVESDKYKRQRADDWVALMTPVIKAFSTDVGSESANLAVQIYGGHGFIKDHGVEQFVRDARIAQLYEGTNGIQALDFVGRKLPMHNGRLLKSFFHLVKEYIEENAFNYNLKESFPHLMKSFERLQKTTAFLASNGLSDPEEGAGPATEYLKMFALTSLGYVWVRYIDIAHKKMNDDPKGFYKAKIATGEYFLKKILPETGFLMSSILSGAKTYNNFEDEYFESSFN